AGRQTPHWGKDERVSLVDLVIESLMDPADLGVKFTEDPMVCIRRHMEAHTGGWGIVPGQFGGSGNSEFEILTGMSMCFLPDGRWASDHADVDAIIDAADRAGNNPFFVHAFTAASHSPYNYEAYATSDLDVAEPMEGKARKESKTYVNAIRAADTAVEKLIRK